MRLGIRLLEINHVPAHGEASSLYLMAMAGSAGAATDRSASAHPILQGNVRQAHNVGSSCRSRIHYVLFTCGGTKKRHKVALEGMGAVPKLVCATFDEFEAHLFGFDGRYHLTGPERGEWRSQAFCVERILVQLVSEGAACAYEGVTLHGWATLFVPRSPPQWYRMLGVPMDDRSLIHFAPGQEFRAAVNSANQWLSLSAPAELLQSGIDNDASAVGANRCLDLEPATIAALIKMLDRLASLEATGMLPTKPLSGILEDQLLTLWRFALGRGVHRVSGKGRPAAPRAAIFSKAV